MFRFWMRLGAISPLVAVSLVFTLPIKSALASSYQSPLSQSIESTYAQNSPIAITNVRLSETDGEVVIVLETDGELPQPITAVSDNTLTSDISNAVLALPEGDIFSTISPTNDISQITIVNLANNQVRVEIVGNETVPSIETSVDTDGLALTVFTDSEAIDIVEADDGILRITVTGEDTEDYRVPNASTATRTDTPILDIPASIQIIPQQVLEDQQVTRLDEALANVSGVTFGGTFVGTSLNFNVRGFDAPTLRNGIRDFGGFTGVNPAITNLDRVEVLKGPASILYGEVQPGGVINLVTEQPLNEPTYEIALQAGSREFFQPEIDLSGPLASDGSLLYRLNAAYSHDDGFTDFNEDLEQIFVAPVLTWQPSDRTRLTLEAEYLDDRQPFETGAGSLW
ncbi:MAG: TonB-dependent receptor plug domain-containing protein [Cyanobacteria bacterium P01_D01_bin.56]